VEGVAEDRQGEIRIGVADGRIRSILAAAKRSTAAMETSRSVSSAGTVLRKKTQINFGGEGLPLSELSNVAAMVRGKSSPVSVGKNKVGRNDPCPCGSGKKFKKCCGS
jgi:uncharacterized protein YecA (UPF0149 family)